MTKKKKCYHQFAPLIENKELYFKCIECNITKIDKPAKPKRKAEVKS